MSDIAVVALSLAAVLVVVTVCLTVRPGAAAAVSGAFQALAAVLAALWPWRR